jgi:hypothetical protein
MVLSYTEVHREPQRATEGHRELFIDKGLNHSLLINVSTS